MRGAIVRTPLYRSDRLSHPPDSTLHLKLENRQLTGAFKIRGAVNKLGRLKEAGYEGPVLAVSAGNHGLAVAVAARSLGWRATVVVPENAAVNKVAAILAAGAELIRHGASYDPAEQKARALARERQVPFISPYNDLDIVMGQATVGLEMLEESVDWNAILVPVGGGGLLAGMALAVEAMGRPGRTEVIGVQPRNSPGMHDSLRAGRIVQVIEEPTSADGLAGNIEPGSVTFEIIQRSVRRILLVDESEIRSAMIELHREEQLVAEPSGAVSVAGWSSFREELPEGQIGAVISGGNIDPQKHFSGLT